MKRSKTKKKLSVEDRISQARAEGFRQGLEVGEYRKLKEIQAALGILNIDND